MSSTARPTPREKRMNRLLVVRIEGADLLPQLAVISDLSADGAHCRAASKPAPDTQLVMQLDSFGSTTCTVRWSEGGHFGVEFAEPVDVIAIMLSRTGFRTTDYDVSLTPEFEGILMSELFRLGEFG